MSPKLRKKMSAAFPGVRVLVEGSPGLGDLVGAELLVDEAPEAHQLLAVVSSAAAAELELGGENGSRWRLWLGFRGRRSRGGGGIYGAVSVEEGLRRGGVRRVHARRDSPSRRERR